MYVMVLVLLLSSGLTNEQRLYPFSNREGCEAALRGAAETWHRTDPFATLVSGNCERMR
jgi:hypothetical protein